MQRIEMVRLSFARTPGSVALMVALALGVLWFVAAYVLELPRRYLSKSSTGDVKMLVGALARAVDHDRAGGLPGTQLCGSATPAPRSVPKGDAYAVNTAVGEDFDTGDRASGWKCLTSFRPPAELRYQVEYRVGGPYKGAARGAPDPGPTGYEISAEGDLNGDGRTSLFVLSGTFDAKTNTVSRSALLAFDEFE